MPSPKRHHESKQGNECTNRTSNLGDVRLDDYKAETNNVCHDDRKSDLGENLLRH